MQSDTLIGIVGAAVLVAVMIGVFAYEYNNAPTDGVDGEDQPSQQQRMDQFNETFPTLRATQDIDGDGTPNWQDDDVDGDGSPNAQDDVVEVTYDLSGSAPANTNPVPGSTGSPASIGSFMIGNGALDYTIEVDHGTGQTGTFRAQVTAGDAGSCTTGQDGTCTISPTGETGQGSTYNVEARQTTLNPNALPVSATVTVTYG